MPKSNGFQVCRTIRQQLQPTKIIVVSGRDYAVDRASALEAGADEFLLKPITWEVLREFRSDHERRLPQRNSVRFRHG
jgi:two-component system, OmpR family, response regulator